MRVTVVNQTKWSESRTEAAPMLMQANPINTTRRTASAGWWFKFTSCASQLAMTRASTATKQQITAWAPGLYQDICVLFQRESTKAAGARAAKKARNKTGRILRSSDMATSGMALKYSLAHIASTR